MSQRLKSLFILTLPVDYVCTLGLFSFLLCCVVRGGISESTWVSLLSDSRILGQDLATAAVHWVSGTGES